MAALRPFVGSHVDTDHPLRLADVLGAECVQIFLSDPQSFKKPPDRRDEEELRSSTLPIYVHSPYRINVCSPHSNVRYGSRRILQQTLTAAERIGAAGVVVHGGHAEDELDEGFGRWVRTIETLETTVPVLIENTAGGNNAVTRRLSDFARLWEALTAANPDVPLGICIDTCHLHAAGEDLTDAIERAIATLGGINLLHANDSRDEAGSGRDRHTSLGTGKVPLDALHHMIRAAGAPVICENKQPAAVETMQADMAFVREAFIN